VIVIAMAVAARGGDLPSGRGQFTLTVAKVDLEVFTYRPTKFDPAKGRLLLVFHGVNRNADQYRDWAISLADATGAVVAAPRFTKEAFPTAKYQLGNVLKDGKATPAEEWTWRLVPKVADEVRKRIGRADAPFDLIGHSAGGQFLVRSAAFLDTGATSVVAANPGTHLFPTRDMKYPLGFGGLPDGVSNDDAIRRYLARPLTLHLGSADTEADANLDKSEPALKQGASRYERGRNAYRLAKQLAADRGWEFRWKLVEADGIGHSAAKMFEHPSARLALTGRAK
jgi:poly(3-hydroxybutyrate) depolymerase